ncbi:matrix metalloproteinase-14-like isoform X5 [Leptotrombidium deliense]|uniref:Matrix metalloproteinase-14-like isoform X5 n=1 Tax=Leptotrombidium deliense TaxID=299467 RepID=A0A443SQY9_9ACAR|nr:matrix metalloproteinase-14-like isoform X5 [Leptotrombidium deliense]
MWIYWLLLTYSIQISKCENKASPLLDLCDDGLIDTAVRTVDGNVYLFKNKHYFRVNQNLDAVDKIEEIESTWEKLPTNVEASFTITDESNEFYGKTLFIKVTQNGKSFFVFHNTQFIRQVSANDWSFFPERVVYAVNEFNNSVVGLYNVKLSRQQLFVSLVFAVYLIDDLRYPTAFSANINANAQKKVSFLDLKAIISFPNKSILAFFEDDGEGWFCFMNFGFKSELSAL